MKKPLIRISFPIMFCVLSTLVILFAAREALSQVNIPDANLRAAIEDELNKESGDTITEDEMASEDFTFLSADDSSISDLTGLEYATSLKLLKSIYLISRRCPNNLSITIYLISRRCLN